MNRSQSIRPNVDFDAFKTNRMCCYSCIINRVIEKYKFESSRFFEWNKNQIHADVVPQRTRHTILGHRFQVNRYIRVTFPAEYDFDRRSYTHQKQYSATPV